MDKLPVASESHTRDTIGEALALVDQGTTLVRAGCEKLVELFNARFGGAATRCHFDFEGLDAGLWSISKTKSALFTPGAVAEILLVSDDGDLRMGVFRDLHPDYVFVFCTRNMRRNIVVLRADKEAR